MRLIFGTILVLGGILGAMLLSRLLPRMPREAGAEGGVRTLRLVAMPLVPIGALMVVSSAVRMSSAGHVGVAVLFANVQPAALREGINLVNPSTMWSR
jgi:hypothetical protein